MFRVNPEGSLSSVRGGTITLDDMQRYLIPFYDMQTGRDMTGQEAIAKAMPAIEAGRVDSWPEEARVNGVHPSVPFEKAAHDRLELDVLRKSPGGANRFGANPFEALFLPAGGPRLR